MELGLISLAILFVAYVLIALWRTPPVSLSEVPPGTPSIHSKVICPYCHIAGHVTVTHHTVKAGISGAKAAGAVLTAGSSILFTGLSRKAQTSQARCKNCEMSWTL